MKLLLSISLLTLSSSAYAATFDCKCVTRTCVENSKLATVTYDPKTQFIEIDAPTHLYSGYVTRQKNKQTGSVYLTLPSTYSFGNQTIEINEERNGINIDRRFSLHGLEYACLARN